MCSNGAFDLFAGSLAAGRQERRESGFHGVERERVTGVRTPGMGADRRRLVGVVRVVTSPVGGSGVHVTRRRRAHRGDGVLAKHVNRLAGHQSHRLTAAAAVVIPRVSNGHGSLEHGHRPVRAVPVVRHRHACAVQNTVYRTRLSSIAIVFVRDYGFFFKRHVDALH